MVDTIGAYRIGVDWLATTVGVCCFSQHPFASASSSRPSMDVADDVEAETAHRVVVRGFDVCAWRDPGLATAGGPRGAPLSREFAGLLTGAKIRPGEALTLPVPMVVGLSSERRTGADEGRPGARE